MLGMLAFLGTILPAPIFPAGVGSGTAGNRCRKSGGWLNSVKVVMGFVELGVALKYISVVDQQWFSVPWLFDFTNVMTLWSVLSILYWAVFDGPVPLVTRHSGSWPVAHSCSLRCRVSDAGWPVRRGSDGTGTRSMVCRSTGRRSRPHASNNEEFLLDFDDAVAKATAKNTPLFIDFTGVFCVNCRLMEKRMAKPHNHDRLKNFVQVQLYTDKVPKITDEAKAKEILERNNSLQVDWFGDVTLPAYAVVTPDGKTILSSFLGLESHEGDFARFLDEGAKKWNSIKMKTANVGQRKNVELKF